METPYTLYTDKSIVFECKISLEGAKLKNTVARLVIESQNHTLLYRGIITNDGICKISIPKLPTFMESGEFGNIKLEVISEEMYFQPWKSSYVVDTSRKLTVEVFSPQTSNKPALQVNIKPQLDTKILKIVSELSNNGISLKNILFKKSEANSILKEHKLTHSQLFSILKHLN